MSTYNRDRYHTERGRELQKQANRRLQTKRKLAWEWLTANRPDVIEEIINQMNKETQQ